MTQSAVSERKAATASRLTTISRRLTAERGLNGFTLEQLCDEVGISRRTFFNYFPSKEECVLGVDESGEAERFALAFLERGTRGWGAILDDLVELGAEFASAMDLGLAEHSDFIAAVEREPRLLARALGMNRLREQQLAELIAEREGTTPADDRVQAVVGIFGTLLRSTVERLMLHGGTTDFHSTLLSSLAAMRDVLATPIDRKAHA